MFVNSPVRCFGLVFLFLSSYVISRGTTLLPFPLARCYLYLLACSMSLAIECCLHYMHRNDDGFRRSWRATTTDKNVKKMRLPALAALLLVIHLWSLEFLSMHIFDRQIRDHYFVDFFSVCVCRSFIKHKLIICKCMYNCCWYEERCAFPIYAGFGWSSKSSTTKPQRSVRAGGGNMWRSALLMVVSKDDPRVCGMWVTHHQPSRCSSLSAQFNIFKWIAHRWEVMAFVCFNTRCVSCLFCPDECTSME